MNGERKDFLSVTPPASAGVRDSGNRVEKIKTPVSVSQLQPRFVRLPKPGTLCPFLIQHFEPHNSISSIVHWWSVNPAAWAAILGPRLAVHPDRAGSGRATTGSHRAVIWAPDSSNPVWVEHLIAGVCFFLHLINHNTQRLLVFVSQTLRGK
jgi:hypothetical protein